ncbi:hypothetical protein CY34DRAFT_369351 [Suillus luteus UH-Slu-Lm8-n1]|uniref:Multiple myeloma tumor-associated protein 2-like N-terminal domain-containing protein n=1 Tax=Suillus luteus UH-Slu-Lm8-n1 TaxID=930992 RepID=A0A0D0BAL1_9AGAM|nr:hypothetical protein CY34DRAFT_369351 [Suillus luteus UH-Slu-Lm8-n1]
MFEPIRGGTRGGQAEFKWTDVSADKDRENYLGHSINAPTGRWQKNKDVHWYNRDNKDDAEKEEEIRKIKEAEAEALSAALGFAAAPSGSIPVAKAPSSVQSGPAHTLAVDDGQHPSEKEKEEKRRKKAERREEKKARKEARRESRHADYERRSRRDRTRSRSPRPSKDTDHDSRRYARHSRSPLPAGRSPRATRDYDAVVRERDRERDRRRWDSNQRDRLSTRHERD